ncbi:lytic murein transglycosylase [Novosphingobium umbonatum]|uniref:Lytic murein transglycosylase n=1 Tax=Novosphingobium umbonatum TaxID=1908524 RepID=A0A437N8L4_9SPHN|nr:lytic murein transglycosylase [Novosphingobium umbonatum]
MLNFRFKNWLSGAACCWLLASITTIADAQPAPIIPAQPLDLAPATAPTPQDPDGFQAYLQMLAARARAEGVSEATITAMTSGISYNPRVVQLDRNQPGASNSPTPPAYTPYRLSHVDAARINRGRAVLRGLGDTGAQVEARYGVPVPILLAIWGAETDYGAAKGGFDLARALATLAFEGRRRELFAGEFVALLKMADKGVPRDRLTGSWAGALGNPQFLPSVYLRYAKDADGDGLADIWNSRPDTLASIAAYFRSAGWQKGLPWGVQAQVPADLNRDALQSRLESPSCARVHARHSQWKTMAEWRALGVTSEKYLADNTLAALIEPDGIGKTAYLLTGNYRVILDYNCSNYYALSVGLLADEIAR